MLCEQNTRTKTRFFRHIKYKYLVIKHSCRHFRYRSAFLNTLLLAWTECCVFVCVKLHLSECI